MHQPSELSVSGRVRMNRWVRGFLWLAIALFAVYLYIIGLGIRSCLPENPGLIPLLSVELMVVGVIFTVPAEVLGFVFGYFVAPRLHPGRQRLLAFLLPLLGFGIGCATGRHGACFPL